MWRVGSQSSVVFGGASYAMMMFDVVSPMPAIAQPRIDQWLGILDRPGLVAFGDVGELVHGRDAVPWRAALAIVL